MENELSLRGIPASRRVHRIPPLSGLLILLVSHVQVQHVLSLLACEKRETCLQWRTSLLLFPGMCPYGLPTVLSSRLGPVPSQGKELLIGFALDTTHGCSP